MRLYIHLRALFLCTLAFLAVGPASGKNFLIGRNGMLNVDGKPLFVLGLYENLQEDAVLEQVAEAGFNLVHVSNKKEELDRLQKHGLWGWVNTGYSIDLSVQTEERKEQLKQLAQGVQVLGKDVHGETWWIVVNEYPDPLRYTLHGLDELNGQVFMDPDAQREAVVKEGQLTCDIESHGVQVLRPATQ